MIERILEKTIKNQLNKGKAIVLLGARQVGKTTLLKTIFGKSLDVLWLNGDELDVQALFESISATRLKAIFGPKKIIVIDEAQRIKDIGLRMKLITDQIPEVQLIATGSSVRAKIFFCSMVSNKHLSSWLPRDNNSIKGMNSDALTTLSSIFKRQYSSR